MKTYYFDNMYEIKKVRQNFRLCRVSVVIDTGCATYHYRPGTRPFLHQAQLQVIYNSHEKKE